MKPIEPLTAEEVAAVRVDLAKYPAMYDKLQVHEPLVYARRLLATLDVCHEAYLNTATERDMYEVAYKDMRTVVADVLARDVPPNIRTRLEAVFMDGEVTPA